MLVLSLVVCFSPPAVSVLAQAASAENRQEPGRAPSISAARDLYERGFFGRAREMLDALIRAGVREPEVLYLRGMVEPSAEVALESYFGEVERRYPSTEWADRARFEIGMYRFASGLYMTARRLLGEVAWRQGESTLAQRARYWRAMTWTHNAATADSLRQSLYQLKSLLGRTTDPEVQGLILVSTGEISLRVGQADSALGYARELLEAPYLEDYHPRALLVIASAWDVLGDQEQARTNYQTLDRRWPETWEGERASLWLAQQREEAVQVRLDSLRAGGNYPVAQAAAGEGDWTIQEGAYADLANAARRVMELNNLDYPAWHASTRRDGRIFVVVLIGGFATRTEAEAYADAMQERGHILDFMVIRKP